MDDIKQLINTPYIPQKPGDSACWSFCKTIRELLEMPVPKSIRQLKRVGKQDKIMVGDIVLFNFRDHKWHTGIVWPNALFFIHARPPLDSNLPDSPYMIEKKSLQDPFYSMLMDGFFRG